MAPVRVSPHNVQVSRVAACCWSLECSPARACPKIDPKRERTTVQQCRARLLTFYAVTMSADNVIDIEVGREPAHVNANRATC